MAKGITLVFDGNNTAYRCNCTSELYTKDGRRASAIMGVLNTTHSTIEKVSEQIELPVKQVIYSWDLGHSPRRKELFPEYKANRKKEHQSEEDKTWMSEFIEQANQLYENLGYFGVKSYRKKNWEGDDIIYGIKKILEQRNPEDIIVIVSTDEDFHQLVTGNTYLYSPVKDIMYTPDNYEELMGIKQECFLTYKIMKGDTSDGISGIQGIGEKTGKKLVNDYGKLEDLLQHGDELKKSKVTGRLFTQEGLEILDRNNKLINLADYVDTTEIDDEIVDMLDEEPYVDNLEAKEFLKSYQLTSILVKYKEWIDLFKTVSGNFSD